MAIQQGREHSDELKIGGRSHVVHTALSEAQLSGQVSGVNMERLAHLHDRLTLLCVDIELFKKLVCHRFEGVLRPNVEPINRAAVNKRWELPQPLPECTLSQ